MDNSIKASTFGSLHENLFFNKNVSISFDDLTHNKDADYKVMVQIEPPSLLNIIDDIIHNKNNFDLILSWHDKILLQCDNSIKFPFGSCWISESDRTIHQKTKNISIISSGKRMTYGHRLRHDIINQYGSIIDVYGNGYNYVHNKITALKDYRFSIIIENDQSNNWFTEKIIDCLTTGTIPVYWGCDNIGEYFNEKGFIRFENIDDFNSKLHLLNNDTYNEMLPYVNDNFSRSLMYTDFWGRLQNIIKENLLKKYGSNK